MYPVKIFGEVVGSCSGGQQITATRVSYENFIPNDIGQELGFISTGNLLLNYEKGFYIEDKLTGNLIRLPVKLAKEGS